MDAYLLVLFVFLMIIKGEFDWTFYSLSPRTNNKIGLKNEGKQEAH